ETELHPHGRRRRHILSRLPVLDADLHPAPLTGLRGGSMGSGAHADRAQAPAGCGGLAYRAVGTDRRRAVTDDDARVEGTVAEVEAWWHTLDEGNPLPAAAAAGALADLFRRAGRVGADLHDPSAELLRWLTRDLARDPDVTDEA